MAGWHCAAGAKAPRRHQRATLTHQHPVARGGAPQQRRRLSPPRLLARVTDAATEDPSSVPSSPRGRPTTQHSRQFSSLPWHHGDAPADEGDTSRRNQCSKPRPKYTKRQGVVSTTTITSNRPDSAVSTNVCTTIGRSASACSRGMLCDRANTTSAGVSSACRVRTSASASASGAPPRPVRLGGRRAVAVVAFEFKSPLRARTDCASSSWPDGRLERSRMAGSVRFTFGVRRRRRRMAGRVTLRLRLSGVRHRFRRRRRRRRCRRAAPDLPLGGLWKRSPPRLFPLR